MNDHIHIRGSGNQTLVCTRCGKGINLFLPFAKHETVRQLAQRLIDFEAQHALCNPKGEIPPPLPLPTIATPRPKQTAATVLGLKPAVCIYHKNIFAVYKREWIDKCLNSIRTQTYQQFEVYEVNYGSDTTRLWTDQPCRFWNKPLEGHAEAMNFIFDQAFQKCNVIFNVNLDDYYAPNRFEKQLQSIKQGYDLVSSDFRLINEKGELAGTMQMSKKNMLQEMTKNNNNIIAHPVIAMTGNFWVRHRYYLHSEYLKRAEDFEMWKRALAKNEKIFIVPEILLFHRLHANQTGKQK